MTSTTQEWHIDDALRDRYVAGALQDAPAWSVEAHVAGCAACRGRFQVGGRLETVWDRVEDDVDAASRRPVERLLVRAGMAEHVARLLAATPSLTAAWFAGLAAVLGLAVAAGHVGMGSVDWLPYLVVAPLAPLAGIALAYGPAADPAHEVGLAAPLRGLRLLLLRAVPVIVASLTLGVALTPLLGPMGVRAVAWLLPALAVSAAALALSSWATPLTSAVVVGVGWVAGVTAIEVSTDAAAVVFGAAGQATAAAVAGLAAAIVVARAERFDRSVGT